MPTHNIQCALEIPFPVSAWLSHCRVLLLWSRWGRKKKLWLEKLLLVILDIFNYEKKIALTFNLLPLMYSFWTYCVHSFDLFSLSVKWKRKFHLCIRSNTQINISWKNFFFLPSSRNLFSISCFNYFCKFFKHSRMLLKL